MPSKAPVTCPKKTGNLKKLNHVMVSWGDSKSAKIKSKRIIKWFIPKAEKLSRIKGFYGYEGRKLDKNYE